MANIYPWAGKYEAMTNEPADWWISPAKGESYTRRFRGTFNEAVVEAASSSAYWRSVVGIFEDHSGAGVAPKDRIGPLWATVSIPNRSPLQTERAPG